MLQAKLYDPEDLDFIKNLESPYEIKDILTLLFENNILNHDTLEFIKAQPQEKPALLEIIEICSIVQKKGFLDQNNFKNIYLRSYKKSFGEEVESANNILNSPDHSYQNYNKKFYVDALLQKPSLDLSKSNLVVYPHSNSNQSIETIERNLKANDPYEFKINSEKFYFIEKELALEKETHLVLLARIEHLLNSPQGPYTFSYLASLFDTKQEFLKWSILLSLQKQIFSWSEEEVKSFLQFLQQEFYNFSFYPVDCSWVNFFDSHKNNIREVFQQCLYLAEEFSKHYSERNTILKRPAELSIKASCILRLSPISLTLQENNLLIENFNNLYKYAHNLVSNKNSYILITIEKCILKLSDKKALNQVMFKYVMHFRNLEDIEQYLTVTQVYPSLRAQIDHYLAMHTYTVFRKKTIINWFQELHENQNLEWVFHLCALDFNVLIVLWCLEPQLITQMRIYETLNCASLEELNTLFNPLPDFNSWLYKFAESKKNCIKEKPCADIEKYEQNIVDAKLSQPQPVEIPIFIKLLLALSDFSLETEAKQHLFKNCEDLKFLPQLLNSMSAREREQLKYFFNEVPANILDLFFTFIFNFAQAVRDYSLDETNYVIDEPRNVVFFPVPEKKLQKLKNNTHINTFVHGFVLSRILVSLTRLGCEDLGFTLLTHFNQWIATVAENSVSFDIVMQWHLLIKEFVRAWHSITKDNLHSFLNMLLIKFTEIVQHENALEVMLGFKVLHDNVDYLVQKGKDWIEEIFQYLLRHSFPHERAKAFVKLKRGKFDDAFKKTITWLHIFAHVTYTGSPLEYSNAVLFLKDEKKHDHKEEFLLAHTHKALIATNNFLHNALLIRLLNSKNAIWTSSQNDEKYLERLMPYAIEIHAMLKNPDILTCRHSIDPMHDTNPIHKEFLTIVKEFCDSDLSLYETLFSDNKLTLDFTLPHDNKLGSEPEVLYAELQKKEILVMLILSKIYLDVSSESPLIPALAPIVINYCCALNETTIGAFLQESRSHSFFTANFLSLFPAWSPNQADQTGPIPSNTEIKQGQENRLL